MILSPMQKRVQFRNHGKLSENIQSIEKRTRLRRAQSYEFNRNVDSLTLFQFCMNCGAQYGGLVVPEAAGSMNDISPSRFRHTMSGRARLTDPATKSNNSTGAELTIINFSSFKTLRKNTRNEPSHTLSQSWTCTRDSRESKT